MFTASNHHTFYFLSHLILQTQLKPMINLKPLLTSHTSWHNYFLNSVFEYIHESMSTCIIRKVNYAFLFTIFCCVYCVPSFYLLSSFEYITQLKGWAVCLKWSTNIQQQKFALSRDCLWCPYNSIVTFVKMNQLKNYLPIFFFCSMKWC